MLPWALSTTWILSNATHAHTPFSSHPCLRTVTHTHDLVAFHPQSVASRRGKIKVIGGGHSFSEIAVADNATLVSLDDLDSVLDVSRVSPDYYEVTVQVGDSPQALCICRASPSAVQVM